jgi:hypothetical protein
MASVKIKWRWGLLAALPIVMLALLPQVRLIIDRGGEWHGANASMHPDEVAYSGYAAAVARGRPRKVDPYTERAYRDGTPIPESLYSIQFVPVYIVALLARWLGLTTASAYICGSAVFAAFCALAVFWLVTLLTRDEKVGLAAVWIVLGLGTLMAGQGLASYVLNLPYFIPEWISKMVHPTSIYHLPFLRFYQPAIALPLFFVLCALVWIGLTTSRKRDAGAAAVGAGIVFALLVFSYFFLWTTAVAWLGCVGVLWFIARPTERRRTLAIFAAIAVLGLPSLALYFRLLSQRAATVDSAQALVLTHRPDLFRLPEISALVVLVALFLGVGRSIFARHDGVVLFAASLALAVLGVFNQQIITGRSLQPIHYEWFIGNYCALIALLLTATLWRRRDGRGLLTNTRLVIVALIALSWGAGEVWLASSLNVEFNRRVDELQPVAARLKVLANGDGTRQAGNGASEVPIVLVADLSLADRLPTDAPQAVLWAPRMLVFSGVDEVEDRERFFKQLYYLGYDDRSFAREFDRGNWNFYSGMFPYERLTSVVSGNTKPISSAEMQSEIDRYLTYSRSFNRERAAQSRLSYLVVEAGGEPDYANLDRWYERDSGERIGKFVLYRLKLQD